jgi:hypothetical protein
VDAVAEDEATLPAPYTGVRVASSNAVIHGSSAVSFDVGAVDGEDLADDCPRFDEYPCESVEDLVVRLFAESVSEVGEESVARCPSSEAACFGYSVVASEA